MGLQHCNRRDIGRVCALLTVLMILVFGGSSDADRITRDTRINFDPWRESEVDQSALSTPRFLAALEDSYYIHKQITSGNRMAMYTYTNGFLGNNFNTRAPSLEFPSGTDEEHLVRGGVWIGAWCKDSLGAIDTLVSHATIDGVAGGSSSTESEFAPNPLDYVRRSTLFSDPFWSLDAESEQDLICQFVDDHTHAGELHQAMGVRVIQSIYQFSFQPFDAILFVDFTIINDNPINAIFDLYAGLYAEFASGWKGGHEEWPPSGWYGRKDIVVYPDSLRLMAEHHTSLDNDNCKSWIGYALLGTRPDTIATKTVSMNHWDWDPSGANPATPANDVERYLMLSNGDADGNIVANADNDPVTLLSVGPLGSESFTGDDGQVHEVLWPGDTVSVVFAFVGGEESPSADPPRTQEEDIRFNTEWAQTYFDLRGEIPLPPPSPQLLVEARHGAIELWWDRSPLEFVDPKSKEQDFEGFRVHISEEGKSEGYSVVGQYDIIDTLSFNTGLDAITAPEPRVVSNGETEITYDFNLRIDGLRDGFKYWVSVTSFDTGANDIDPLESGLSQNRQYIIPGPRRNEDGLNKVIVFPNPYHGDAAWDDVLQRDRYIWFAGLPPRSVLRIYNLAGDLIQQIDFDQSSYNGTEVRGIYDPTDTWNPSSDIPVLSGSVVAWDLTTREDQAAATGLYIFTVEDLSSGEIERGKFMIMK